MSETFNLAVVSPRINLFDYYAANLTCQSHMNSFFFFFGALQVSVFLLDLKILPMCFFILPKKKKRENINIILMHDPEHEKNTVEVGHKS